MNTNEKEKISKKTVLIIASIAVLIASAVIFLIIMGGTKECYRKIEVVSTENTSMVNRKKAGEFEVFEGLLLENGDHVDTLSDGRLFLDLDGDKHISAEPNTIFDVELAGSEDLSDARTRINLIEGTITNVIEKPLMENEIYEVETPTGTMAVRGTEFLVVSGVDSDEKYSEVQVTKGKVEVYRPEDEAAGSVTVDAGKMLIIKESDEVLSDLVPWNIGEEPPKNVESADNPEESDELKYYDFGFSFEDFKFDGKTIDANTLDEIIANYNVNKSISAGAGEAFSSDDGNIMLTFLDEVPDDQYLSWKTTGEYWETVVIKRYGKKELSFTCDSIRQEKALTDHYSSPVSMGISKAELLDILGVDESVWGTSILCSLSDEQCYIDESPSGNSISIDEFGQAQRNLTFLIDDGVVTGWRLSLSFE